MPVLVNPYVFEVVGGTVSTTWDPANKSADIALSSGNLTAGKTGNTTGGGSKGVQATIGKTTGKYHIEITANTSSSSLRIGVGNSITFNDIGSGSYNRVEYVSSGQVREQIAGGTNTLLETIESNWSGVIVAVEIDMDNHHIYFQKNGSSRHGPYSFSNVSGTAYPFIGIATDSNEITVNFGNTPFTITPTAGYGTWS